MGCHILYRAISTQLQYSEDDTKMYIPLNSYAHSQRRRLLCIAVAVAIMCIGICMASVVAILDLFITYTGHIASINRISQSPNVITVISTFLIALWDRCALCELLSNDGRYVLPILTIHPLMISGRSHKYLPPKTGIKSLEALDNFLRPFPLLKNRLVKLHRQT